MRGTKKPTVIWALEEIRLLELELLLDGAFRRRVERLKRILVQEVTVGMLTIERLMWLTRPLLSGQADHEEKIIRTRMTTTVEKFDEEMEKMNERRYDRIPLGPVNTAKQIIATGEAYKKVYEPVQSESKVTQTEPQENDSWSEDSMDQVIEEYFAEVQEN